MVKPHLTLFRFQEFIRNFLRDKGFLEVSIPPLVENPGYETHLQPLQAGDNLFLHTSPEYGLKELLSQGHEDIFSLNFSFRNDPHSPHHRKQFLMLEWYKVGEDYHYLMEQTTELIQKSYQFLESLDLPMRKLPKARTVSVHDLFREHLDFSPFDYSDAHKFRKRIKDLVPLPPTFLEWDDLFFMLFLNCLEPKIKDEFLILKDYPAPLAALSKVNQQGLAERFEIYLNGIELCNGYTELTDLSEQKKRHAEESRRKESEYGLQLKPPSQLFNALERGLPDCSGNALGIERLLMALTHLDDVFLSSK